MINMNWIKVTPETMPPDKGMVLVTVKDYSGGKWVGAGIRWNKRDGKWERWHSDGFWNNLPLGDEVTHWMPMPEPAED